MPRSCIKISNKVVFGIPKSASSYRTVSHQPLLVAAHTHSISSGVLLVAGLPGCGSLLTDSWPSLKHLCHTFLCCTHCIVPESLLNHPNSFRGGMFKFNAKFDANSLLYSLSHFECDSLTVHMLTQWYNHPHRLGGWLHMTPVKSLLFARVHSSALSLDINARLHRCHASCSHYVNNGWTFSGQTSSYRMFSTFHDFRYPLGSPGKGGTTVSLIFP